MVFPGQSEVVPIRTQRVPQTIETRVTFTPVPSAYVRYAYARSSDSMASQIEGQDYLCFRHNDQRLAFIVADGVGSSFCGNLAARILGDGLLDWLWSLDIAYLGGSAALQEAATSFLNRLQKTANIEVEEYEIPENISGLIRQALEQQRAYGSEAIFAAARIDHPSAMIPEGLLSIFWMGDTQMRVVEDDGEFLPLEGSWANANRWSTTQGVKGTMSALMRPLTDIQRVAAFTDGLSAHAATLLDYSDDRLDREISLGSRLPTSDDVAFIDVVLRSPVYEGYADPELPDPNAERPSLEQIWNPTHTGRYELRWNWPGQSKAKFIVQEARNPALNDARTIEVVTDDLTWKPESDMESGHYYYRVRAVSKHGTVTPWSELRKTRVAEPPPPAPKLLPVESETSPVLQWTEEGDTLEYKLQVSRDAAFAEPDIAYDGRGNSWVVPTSDYKPGTYYFRVGAFSDGGESPWSEVQTVQITLPAPPRPHLGSAAIGMEHGSYELRWQPVPGATRYEIEEMERVSGETRTFETEDGTYQLIGQPVGEYVYRVRGCHDYGCGEWSNEQLVMVAPQRPVDAPVLSVEISEASQQIDLSWTDVENAVSYIVQASPDAGFQNAQSMESDELALSIPRSEPGRLYLRVCGANRGGQGPWSNIEEAAIAPRAPGWIEAEVVENKHIALSWGTTGGRVDYRLQALLTEGGKEQLVELYFGSDTHFEYPITKGVSRLVFRVRSETGGDMVSRWQESDSTHFQAPPSTPILEEPTIDEKSQVTLRWTPVAGAVHYTLEVSQDETFARTMNALPAEGTTVLFNPPGSGRYWFRVKAADKSMQSAASNIQSIVVERPVPPHLWPIDPVKVGSPYEVSWKGMPGVAYYDVESSSNPQFDDPAVVKNRVQHPTQKLMQNGQRPGKLYYRVRAVDERSQASRWSDVLAVEIR